MPGPQREPGWVTAPASLYLKGIGSVASSLPLAGPNKGSLLEIFELISVSAETADFLLPTPRGEWRGHISCPVESWDQMLREHRGLLLVDRSTPLVTRNSPVARRDTLPFWQGFRVRTEQGMGCV